MIHSKKKKKKILKNNKDCENLKICLLYNNEYNKRIQNNMNSYQNYFKICKKNIIFEAVFMSNVCVVRMRV